MVRQFLHPLIVAFAVVAPLAHANEYVFVNNTPYTLSLSFAYNLPLDRGTTGVTLGPGKRYPDEKWVVKPGVIVTVTVGPGCYVPSWGSTQLVLGDGDGVAPSGTYSLNPTSCSGTETPGTGTSDCPDNWLAWLACKINGIHFDGTEWGSPIKDCSGCSREADGQVYTVRSAHNDNRCLAYDWNDGRLKQWTCDKHPSKLMYFGLRSDDSGFYFIRVEMGGRCLDYPAKNNALEGGRQVNVLQCNGSIVQRWALARDPNKPGFHILNKANGLCLDRKSQELGLGGAIQLKICNTSEWQLWYLDPK